LLWDALGKSPLPPLQKGGHIDTSDLLGQNLSVVKAWLCPRTSPWVRPRMRNSLAGIPVFPRSRIRSCKIYSRHISTHARSALTQGWSKASDAFKAGILTDAPAIAKTVKDTATKGMTTLGNQTAAARWPDLIESFELLKCQGSQGSRSCSRAVLGAWGLGILTASKTSAP
jgi:hypothetical protein